MTDSVVAGRESYYTGAVAAGEPAGRWSGAGAEALGLAGDVDAEQMAMIYHHLIDPRDPHAASPATWGLAETLGAPHKNFRSADDIEKAALAREPDAGPERRAELRAEAERAASGRAAVSFVDLTYNAPKSISVLGVAYERAAQEAREAGDHAAAERWQAKATAVEDAVRAGAAASLAHLQSAAGTARVGHHGGGAGRWIDGGGWVIASFLQHDSRDHDPQLHVHNAVLNRQLCADGVWRALDTAAIRREKPAASALGDRVCEAELARALGVVIETRADGKAREVAGVSARLREQFSHRRRTIGPKAAKLVAAFRARHGSEPSPAQRYRIFQQATLSTRASKTHTGETVGERLDRWAGEALAQTRDGLSAVITEVARAAGERGEAPEWSPLQVCEQAVALAAERKSAWTRADLLRAVSDTLPARLDVAGDQVAALLDGLTDRALDQVVRLSARESTDGLDTALVRADGSSVYDSGQVFYAAPWQLAAERALARRADEAGLEAFTADEAARVIARAADGGRELGGDQAAAVTGVLTSGRAVEVLAAPAGTGKSYVVGALADAWTDQTIAPHAGAPRRVFGLATSQNAARVLAGEGLSATANIAAWRAAMARVDARPGSPGADGRWVLRPDDLVVVDEAGMVDTDALAEITRRCAHAGAKLLLTGDDRQLGAVGAGGALADLTGRARTYALEQVRRFDADWEADASLRLRDGDQAVVGVYAKHGRVVDGGTAEQAEARAARGWLADHLDGRDSVLIAASNDAVGRLNATIRAELVALGRVDEHGVALGTVGEPAWAGEVAGIGDLVQARRNGRSLDACAGLGDPPVNRDLYRVLAVSEDGSLTVARVLGRDPGGERCAEQVTLPAGYVAEHISLGYAATVHSVQGRTVDTAHTVAGAGSDPDAVYVGLSRGRVANFVYAITRAVPADAPTGATHDAPARTAAAVLADAIARDGEPAEESATTTAQRSAERAVSVATQLDRLAAETAEATAGRTGRVLDRLAADGALTGPQRAALDGDRAALGQLDRLLRSAELAGHDPERVLTDAVTARSLAGAHSPAAAIHARIVRDGTIRLQPAMTDYAGMVPAGLDEAAAGRLGVLAEAADERRHELAAQCSADPPRWAVDALGAVPDDVFAAHDWEQRAGWAAAYREAVGWTDARIALGPAPAEGLAEHRAAFRLAHAALDLPDERAEEAEMSTGRLFNRWAAAQRERNWLPARVADQMETTALERERRGQDAALYREHAGVAATVGDAAALRGDAETAGDDADRLAGVHAVLDEADRVRGACLADMAVTDENGHRAGAELARRGIDPARYRDDERTSAAEWLAAETWARAEDDEHRVVGEDDVDDGGHEHGAGPYGDGDPILETGPPDIRERVERDPSEDADPAERFRIPDADAVAVLAARARDAELERAARREVDAAEEARVERERVWHADDQAAYDRAVDAARSDDEMAMD